LRLDECRRPIAATTCSSRHTSPLARNGAVGSSCGLSNWCDGIERVARVENGTVALPPKRASGRAKVRSGIQPPRNRLPGQNRPAAYRLTALTTLLLQLADRIAQAHQRLAAAVWYMRVEFPARPAGRLPGAGYRVGPAHGRSRRPAPEGLARATPISCIAVLRRAMKARNGSRAECCS
jgi:hypothetical protein